MRYHTPLFKLTHCYILFHVGLCPTRFLPFASNVDARQALDLVSNNRKASIAWTQVDAIIKSNTCVKATLSGRNRRAHRAPHGITRSVYCHQQEYQRSDGHGAARSSSLRGDAWSVRSPFDGRRQGSVIARSSIFHPGITSTIIGRRSLEHQKSSEVIRSHWTSVDGGQFDV